MNEIMRIGWEWAGVLMASCAVAGAVTYDGGRFAGNHRD